MAIGKEIGWGILGCGNIANSYVDGIASVEGARVVAAASSSVERAQSFALRHGIEIAYGSYQELCEDESVDVIYVATISSLHYEHVLLALNHNKHVIVEKPFALNSVQAQEMITLARSKKLYLQEGMWTRFFPAVRKVQELLQRQAIGRVIQVQADLGCEFPASIENIWNPSLGGSGLLAIGVYPLAHVLLAFEGESPRKIEATGELTENGVDRYGRIVLDYGDARKGIAEYNLSSKTACEVRIDGENGTIYIHPRAHCPTKVSLKCESETREFQFDLPTTPTHVDKELKSWPKWSGFHYQAKAVSEYVVKGATEAAEFPLDESLHMMQIMDEVREQLSVKFPIER